VIHNIKDVLSVQASKVFKFEEQEELHNNIIDKGLLKLCQANIKRAEVMARDFPDVEVETQILIGKPFQVVLQWAEEVDPTLLVFARHGSHRIDGTDLGSQAENLVRLAPCNVLLVGTTEVHPEQIPWIEEDGETGLEWAPEAEVRILRVPPFALGIARRAVEEFVLEHYHPVIQGNNHGAPDDGPSGNGKQQVASLPTVTNERLDEAIRALLPTHMQLIMGIGTAEELALAEVKAEEAMRRTVIEGSDGDEAPATRIVEARCPVTGQVSPREWTVRDPVVWTEEAFERLGLVPLIARPLARNCVEKFAREHAMWRVTTVVMDENKQAMIEGDEFDTDTMLVMFKELQSKQLRAEAEGVDGLTPEMRRFIEEAKAAGVTRCPIRDLEARVDKCPVDFRMATPEEARRAVESLVSGEAAPSESDDAGNSRPGAPSE
jgi:nucleotide-binding universal stress UspA family protein